ncbi:guanine nucleotide-binding protein g(o) subunit alpha [Anaeramoeba flamelloides]|uniref:Guanine nucleotide-binding protein g(O) subunit alpha n=1 Tax=Anaeramoeba flamelloides TaxID=1746091 RepID=A0AAV7ZAZ4_9EUKA|nr:guanine nucleotide-binding protein g(o) subunit alpha [Anaeramoeba flamelloides]KAJ6240677.1 guanine nucleotide-binding protein g(o) subunit alpha [Anaeramoeba flamelloides]
MGNKKNKQKKKDSKKNEILEKQIENDKKKEGKEVKLLILGTGESGKSTFVKQIQLIFKSGFDQKTKELYKETIRHNLIKDTKILVTGMGTLEIDFEPENMILARELLRSEEKECTEQTEELNNTIETLWEDPGLKECFEARSLLQIPDTHGYYLDNLKRITQENYEPTDQDILYCRIPTTGVNSIDFEVEGNSWLIVDVGGQRSERRKWIHHFGDVTMIAYVVALSEYDQKLFEDEAINRMVESISLFESTANNEFFEEMNCIIMFNKIDLFEKKLNKTSLKKWFTEYQGEDNDVESAKKFLSNLFIEVGDNQKRQIFPMYTCGTDTNNIKTIFESIQKIVMEAHEKKYKNL